MQEIARSLAPIKDAKQKWQHCSTFHSKHCRKLLLNTPRGGRRTETEEVDVAIIVALHTRGGLHSRRLLLSKRPPTRHLALLFCLASTNKLSLEYEKEKKEKRNSVLKK
jgi:hypothetical protein